MTRTMGTGVLCLVECVLFLQLSSSVANVVLSLFPRRGVFLLPAAFLRLRPGRGRGLTQGRGLTPGAGPDSGARSVDISWQNECLTEHLMAVVIEANSVNSLQPGGKIDIFQSTEMGGGGVDTHHLEAWQD